MKQHERKQTQGFRLGQQLHEETPQANGLGREIPTGE
jgi:hypothetical protein